MTSPGLFNDSPRSCTQDHHIRNSFQTALPKYGTNHNSWTQGKTIVCLTLMKRWMASMIEQCHQQHRQTAPACLHLLAIRKLTASSPDNAPLATPTSTEGTRISNISGGKTFLLWSSPWLCDVLEGLGETPLDCELESSPAVWLPFSMTTRFMVVDSRGEKNGLQFWREFNPLGRTDPFDLGRQRSED